MQTTPEVGQQLSFLKKLSNRFLRTGDIAHSVIRTYLSALRQGDVWSVDRATSWASQMFQKDITFSRDFRANALEPTEQYQPVLLLEFYFNLPQATERCGEASERLLRALSTFVLNPEFASFRDGALLADAVIERTISVNTGYATLRGKLDLAYKSADRIVVVDWETGAPSSGTESLQLLSYALAAMKHFECDLGQIDLWTAYLYNAATVRHPAGKRDLERAKARIEQDLERMLALHDYGREGIEEAFTPCSQPRVCTMCPFQRVCPAVAR